MTQDERWLARYNDVKFFIESNKRNPSKYAPEERLVYEHPPIQFFVSWVGGCLFCH